MCESVLDQKVECPVCNGRKYWTEEVNREEVRFPCSVCQEQGALTWHEIQRELGLLHWRRIGEAQCSLANWRELDEQRGALEQAYSRLSTAGSGTSDQLTETITFLCAGGINERVLRLQEWLEDPERTQMEMAGALSSAMALINVMQEERG